MSEWLKGTAFRVMIGAFCGVIVGAGVLAVLALIGLAEPKPIHFFMVAVTSTFGAFCVVKHIHPVRQSAYFFALTALAYLLVYGADRLLLM